MDPRISRRTFLAGAGLAGAALTGYTAFYEPEWLEASRHEIKTNVAGEPLKILHLGDLHASWCVSLSYIERALEYGLALKPDLICVTGDFITTKFRDIDRYSRILARLAASAPVYACLGNHDGGFWAQRHHGNADTAWVRSLLQRSNIVLLHNCSTRLRLKNRELCLVGVGDLYSGEHNSELAFAGIAKTGAPYTVVLSHNPDTKDFLRSHPWDLMLSGHTHGGQLCLPLVGAPFAPVVDKRYLAGLYCWQNRWLHITKGIGSIWGLRFNCRPDVGLLTLA